MSIKRDTYTAQHIRSVLVHQCHPAMDLFSEDLAREGASNPFVLEHPSLRKAWRTLRVTSRRLTTSASVRVSEVRRASCRCCGAVGEASNHISRERRVNVLRRLFSVVVSTWAVSELTSSIVIVLDIFRGSRA